MIAAEVGVGSGVGSGFRGLLELAVGFGGVIRLWGGSGSSSSIGVTASFGIIPSLISSFGISIGVRGVAWLGRVTDLIGVLLSSQATSGASTVLPLSIPPT